MCANLSNCKMPLLPNVHASEQGNQSAVSLKDPVRPLETIIANNTLKMGKNSHNGLVTCLLNQLITVNL